jgi:hypothetical protein
MCRTVGRDCGPHRRGPGRVRPPVECRRGRCGACCPAPARGAIITVASGKVNSITERAEKGVSARSMPLRYGYGSLVRERRILARATRPGMAFSRRSRAHRGGPSTRNGLKGCRAGRRRCSETMVLSDGGRPREQHLVGPQEATYPPANTTKAAPRNLSFSMPSLGRSTCTSASLRQSHRNGHKNGYHHPREKRQRH